MKREEAVTLLREISSCCQNLSPDSILLVKSKPEDPLSVGYQLHIQAAIDSETETKIQALSSQYYLAIHHEIGEVIIIYKPKLQVNDWKP
jgi:hypothetical protein